MKVGLVFTDLYSSIHYFSNDNEFKIDFPETSKYKKDSNMTYTYSLADVYFTNLVSIHRDIRDAEARTTRDAAVDHRHAL